MIKGGYGKQDYSTCKRAECVECHNKDFPGCPHKVQHSCHKYVPGADSFSCTVAVINSAILRLSKVTPLVTDGMLYRGLNGMAFPPKYFLDDKMQVPREDEIEAIKDLLRSCSEFGEYARTYLNTQTYTYTLVHVLLHLRVHLHIIYAYTYILVYFLVYIHIDRYVYASRLCFELAMFNTNFHCAKLAGFSTVTPDKKMAWKCSGAAACRGKGKCTSWNDVKDFCEAHRSTILEIQSDPIARTGASFQQVSHSLAEDENVRYSLSS